MCGAPHGSAHWLPPAPRGTHTGACGGVAAGVSVRARFSVCASACARAHTHVCVCARVRTHMRAARHLGVAAAQMCVGWRAGVCRTAMVGWMCGRRHTAGCAGVRLGAPSGVRQRCVACCDARLCVGAPGAHVPHLRSSTESCAGD